MRLLFFIPMLALLLASCQMFSGVRVSDVVSQAPEAAVLRKVLVLGLDATPNSQRVMEQAFSRKLAGSGREVVLASVWFSGEKHLPPEKIIARARAEGMTGMLVMQLLNYETPATREKSPAFSLYTPSRALGDRVGWEQSPGVGEAVSQGRENALPTEPAAIVESRLLDVATGRVVWEAHARMRLEREEAGNYDRFAAAVVEALKKSGWLSRQ